MLDFPRPYCYTPLMDVEKRFWAKVNKSDNGCWLWTGATVHGGYGQFYMRGKDLRAHRASWELTHDGELPSSIHVLHKCDTPSCVNPEHLFLGNHTDNMRDKAKKKGSGPAPRTHCFRGHEFTEENIYRLPSGGRTCRTCKRERRHA